MLRSNNGNTGTVTANAVPNISGDMQRLPLCLENRFSVQKRFQLADTLPQQSESSTIGVLIGSDHYHEVMSSEMVEVQEGLYLIKSKFGWIISGETKTNEQIHHENTMFVMTHSSTQILPELQHFSNTDDSMLTPNKIDNFWKLETIGATPQEKKEHDEAVMDHCKRLVKKDASYYIAWSWKDENCKLPENYELSVGRLKSLQKRLKDDPELLRKYDKVIKNQLAKVVIEVVDDQKQQGNKQHYIPYHAVIKSEKDTKKLRVVYDASTKTKTSSLSLNECLYRGLVILEDICGLLMRFRTKKIGIVADIEKAFLQIGLQPKERDAARFLWLKDINVPLHKSRIWHNIQSIPFGSYNKTHLGNVNATDECDIHGDIYVDNLITVVNNKEGASRLQIQVQKDINEPTRMEIQLQ